MKMREQGRGWDGRSHKSGDLVMKNPHLATINTDEIAVAGEAEPPQPRAAVPRTQPYHLWHSKLSRLRVHLNPGVESRKSFRFGVDGVKRRGGGVAEGHPSGNLAIGRSGDPGWAGTGREPNTTARRHHNS